MSCSSFLTELFDSDLWPKRFFCPVFGKAHRWPNFGFNHLATYPPCCILWFQLLYVCVSHKIDSSLRGCYLVTSQSSISELLWRCKKYLLFSLSLKFKYSTLVWSITCWIISFYHYALTKLSREKCSGVFLQKFWIV